MKLLTEKETYELLLNRIDKLNQNETKELVNRLWFQEFIIKDNICPKGMIFYSDPINDANCDYDCYIYSGCPVFVEIKRRKYDRPDLWCEVYKINKLKAIAKKKGCKAFFASSAEEDTIYIWSVDDHEEGIINESCGKTTEFANTTKQVKAFYSFDKKKAQKITK